MVDIPLSYNGILGRPALAKFMAASHYAYNTLKMLGPQGVITVKMDKKDAVACIEKMYKDSVAASPGNPEVLVTSKAPGKRNDQRALGKGNDAPSTVKKQKTIAGQPSPLTKQVPAREDGSGAFTIGAGLSDK